MMEATPPQTSIEEAQASDVLTELRGIHKAVSKPPEVPREATYQINVDGPTHVRMKLVNILFSLDNVGATAVTLTIGARRFVYNVVGPLTLVVPPPVTVVDRGIDVAAVASAGAVDLAQFRYTAE